MDLLTTPYPLTLPVWGWCLARLAAEPVDQVRGF